LAFDTDHGEQKSIQDKEPNINLNQIISATSIKQNETSQSEIELLSHSPKNRLNEQKKGLNKFENSDNTLDNNINRG
jgi:hypothetical protein